MARQNLPKKICGRKICGRFFAKIVDKRLDLWYNIIIKWESFFYKKNKAIKKDDIGVENAKPDAIIKALQTAKATTEIERCEFSMDDMFYYGLTGENSKELREKLGDKLSIGYGNAKQFLKKINKYNSEREELEKALDDINGK